MPGFNVCVYVRVLFISLDCFILSISYEIMQIIHSLVHSLNKGLLNNYDRVTQCQTYTQMYLIETLYLLDACGSAFTFTIV
jgi:hypothetical protein